MTLLEKLRSGSPVLLRAGLPVAFAAAVALGTLVGHTGVASATEQKPAEEAASEPAEGMEELEPAAGEEATEEEAEPAK